MRINELKLDNNILELLTELFSVKGAKEIFAKHNIEMVTEQIEKEGLANFIKQAKELFETSKTVKEYNQAVQFLDLQINTNKSALTKAEGFMKTMIEGMITGFETTKNVAIQNFSPMFRDELKGLLHNIVNKDDKKKIEEYINEYDITKLNEMLELVKSIELAINSRYCETERKVDNDITEGTEEVKQVKVEQNNLFETEETEEKSKAKKERKQETKEKEPIKPKEEHKEEDIDDNDLDDLFSDEDFEEFLGDDENDNGLFEETGDDLDF